MVDGNGGAGVSANTNTNGGGVAAVAVYAAIARQFVMTLNGSMLYGCSHPNTAKNAAALCEAVCAALEGRDMVTVIANNGSLIIEDWPLDKTFNVAKLLRHFDRIGLVSVSFERGVTPDAVIRLIGLAGDANRIDACRAGILDAKTRGNIENIRVNYVLYGKIRADEVVVKDSRDVRAAASGEVVARPLSGASNISTGNLSLRAAAEIEEALTLSSLLEKPKEVSAILSRSDTAAIPVGDLQDAFGKIKNEIDGSPARNVDELLGSLYCLKKDLYEAIEAQKATGRIMRSAAVINNELNDLTTRAVVRLVRDEYKSGKTPVNRLAHTIRRMIPANTDLMRILPSLKDMLLEEGMALGDYLELVKALGLKIDSEDLSESLKDAAESMGASVGDLVSAIRSKPEEAARLIMLAAEIRQGLGDEDADRLPELLTNYIEDVCAKMTADTRAAEAGGAGKTLKAVLSQLGTQMYGLLEKQGLPEKVLENVRKTLDGQLANVDKGVADTGANTRDRAHNIKMPAGVLSANNLLFLVNKEIKRCLRYKTPFATIAVSIDGITDAAGTRPPRPEENAELLPQLFAETEPLLRDVDLIGTIGGELFILLPMTGFEGAETVRERIAAQTSSARFSIDGKKVKTAVRVSSACPGPSTTDLKSYLTLSKENHARRKSPPASPD